MDDANTELVQVRISKEAHALLESKARAGALTVASHVRRVLYRDLGLIKGEN
jgi:hypothetical protein